LKRLLEGRIHSITPKGLHRGLLIVARDDAFAAGDRDQILALLARERFGRGTHEGHSIELFVRALSEEARMNLRFRVELSRASDAVAAGANCISFVAILQLFEAEA
jgi:hypothetical protein